tara:strand:+ start:2001 stop:4841 length:2841 start_codon:yes stop_codon:yes gene_type:complete
MGFVNVQTDDGILRFQIEGNTPTALEQSRIQRIILRQAPQRKKAAETKKDEKLFDYKTGIQDLELRRKLSRADTPEDEKLALKSMGLLETDFTRDRRGRLALTPSGAKKFGVDSDRNVMIDESSFSRADFADLSSLGRELIGGVGGAIAGQAAIPIPILGAAIGAGLGTGGAKLLEEGQEVIEGTQSETAGDVFKAAGKEALIAGVAEGAGQVVFKTIGRVFGKPGKDLTPEQLELSGMSIDKFGIKPTLSQIGANKLVARQQAMSEKVIGTSPRLRQNHQAIINQLEEFKGAYGASTPDEVADILTQAAKTGSGSVERVRKSISDDVIQFFKQTNESLGAAARKDQSIDDDLFGIFTTAYKAFDDDMQAQFSTINKLIDDASGNQPLFSIRSIKQDAKDRLDQFSGVSGGNQGIAKGMLEDIVNLPDMASFSQLYRARKNINDTWLSRYGSSNVANVKDKFLKRIDNKLEIKEVNKLLRRTGEDLTKEQRALYRAAAKQIPIARKNFKEGIEVFEKINGSLGIRSLVSAVKGGEDLNVAGAMSTLIKPNNPKLLKDAAKAVGGDSVFNSIKTRMASEWLRNTFKKSTKAGKSGAFSTHKFYDEIEKLGSTADELFGKNTAEIKKLAEQMNVLSLSNVSQGMIDDVVLAGADQPAISLLRNLKSVMDEQSAINKSRALKALQDDSLTSTAAAEVIADRGTRDVDVERLIKYFDQPEDLNKIRSFYIDNIVGDFGDTFLTNPSQFKLFGKRLQDEYKTGKLDSIFGKEMAKDMNDFGRVMVFNSKAAEGGDLVAANVAAKPLENLGTIARLFVVGRLFSSAPQYRSILSQYKKMTGNADAKTKAEIFGTLLANSFASLSTQTPAQLIDEGVEETKQQVEALAQNVMKENFPSSQKPTRTSTPVPQVLPPVNTAQGQPISNQNIRQRAKENPAVAATLLGGLGSAGLL